ncbi:GNAT family N-acetyltransferase [Neglectibacter caecimuris]|uniref:GNAT family N-acetyltransferase n=1 Tax=Neglectibacter caecimuris TaxID=3093658 RepID=UPI002AC8E9E6|nr:GNAT family N-acetyltransferase [Neglectibacter sp. M00184]
MTELTEYRGEEARAVSLIQSFWKEHNGYNMPPEEAKEDLAAWTASGHAFYFICREQEPVGFLHLGSRGGKVDWLEDLFVLPTCQNQGIGSEAVRLAEEIVKAYSESMYIEAAARNERAIRLYKRLGYDCLNTVSVRKDFPGHEYQTVREETIYGERFEIRKSR